MSYNLVYLFSFGNLIAGIISCFLFKKIDKKFHPFIYCLWIGCVVDIIGTVTSKMGITNMGLFNSYILIEAFFFTWFFKQVGLFGKKSFLFVVLLTLYSLMWLGENYFFGNIHHVDTYFRVYYSMCIAFMSVFMINRIIATVKRNVLINPLFLICIGFLVYFTFKGFVYSIIIYGASKSHSFFFNVNLIVVYINLGVNLLYAFAVLRMPKDQVKLSFA